MSNETVRIVFYEDSKGEVEKVPRHTFEPCSECGTGKHRDLTNDEAEEIGREAARAIGAYIDGCWYSGLIDELIKRYPYDFIGRAVAQDPEGSRSALQRHDASH